MRDPTVSVVIAAYNAADFIEEALESVFEQTYRDFEIVVVDDGSVDETAALVRRVGGDRVRLVQQENGGSASARNRGVGEARGRYVAFLDADDLWMPAKLERQMALFEHDPTLAWSYTDAAFFDSETGRRLRLRSQSSALPEGDVLRDLLLGNFILVPTVVVRRDVLEETGAFDQTPLHRISEDWDLWLRVAGRCPVRCLREPLARVREHRARKTDTMNLHDARASRQALIRKAVMRHPGRLNALRGRAQAGVLVGLGRKHLEREERAEARRLFSRARHLAPRYTPAWAYLLAAYLPRPLLTLLGRARRAWRQDRQEALQDAAAAA